VIFVRVQKRSQATICGFTKYIYRYV